MEHPAAVIEEIERSFALLPSEEKTAVITHGVAVRFSDLNQRLFLAKSKIRHFEEKYDTKLSYLEEQGLPSTADYEMHEDYILWHHWQDAAVAAESQIAKLQPMIQYGVYR